MPSSRDHPDPGTEPTSLMSPALAGSSLPLVPPGKPTMGPRHQSMTEALLSRTKTTSPVASADTRPTPTGDAALCAVAQSYLTLCDPSTVAHESPLSMGFSRQEHWSGLPCPPPGDLPNPGIHPGLLHCRQILYHLNHQGSPRILECVAYAFSRGSSQPRN